MNIDPDLNPLNPNWDAIGDTVSMLAPETESELAAMEQATPRVRALVLEDDPALMQILLGHLQSLDMEVLQANSVSAARKHLRSNPVQLGIFDVHLPDGSGLELCAEIDEDPQLMGLPVIVLSSDNDERIVRKTRSAGGCYFISKPYDPNVLLAIIERLLGQVL